LWESLLPTQALVMPAELAAVDGVLDDARFFEPYRRFFHTGGSVPDPTTLMKITSRCGQTAVDASNEALLARAVEAKVLRTSRLRADTTVIEANVAYPTDSSLLAKGVTKLAHTARRLQAMGFARRTKLVDRTAA
jgi:IS5 family transposase